MKTAVRTCVAALSCLAFAGVLLADAKPAKKPAAGDVITAPTNAPAKESVLSHTLKDIDGNDADLSKLKGKVVMFVNVASRCGNTPQYKQLQDVYTKYKDKGLVIVGIPANEFGKQEPGTDAQIKEFCSSKYAVTFPMMGKIVVKGEGIHPLYQQLTTTPGMEGDVSWNFQKYIVDRNGATIAKIAPKTKPDDAKVIEVIEKALAAAPAK
jgi:glutathione peroxidase